ncbi:SDR family NAD(P)-dependent oxidoreductase [Rhodococcus sp. T2V]|uniref:SDR family NAD(P)-dependent oxidoreductase n=1 Tax=Rhodococcus sp. T2V TaxID=3034164 RepID=UPI0023E1CD56|nr:SDR family NAD(P)-dependent oxidoreductase [Rhodococcus sp. T2V]MDF3309695.1 SDR family NAD(P)-dependent oxidoreductase [Rhodococcus sp. T2V]
MEKKIILITGATSGLGREEAKAFLQRGHTVIIHGRSRDKTLAVQRELIVETGNSNVDILVADLLSLAAVKTMVEEFQAKYDRLDVLVNNAGNQFGGTWQATSEGHEKTMTVNLFAPVLLSLLLIDSLKRSEHARIVTVSSASHAQGGRPFIDDIELRDHYSYIRAYGLSKLYVIWAMRRLSKNLKEEGVNTIDVNCTHPGTAKTSLGESDQRPFLMKLLFAVFVPLFATTAEKGAQSTIYAATSPEIEGSSDRYYGPKGLEKVNERYYSPANEDAVWKYCMKVLAPYLITAS